MPFTLITLILIIMVLICFSIAIIWMVKQMKAPAPAQTHPLAFQLPAHSSRVWSQAEAMAAEASRVIAGDELAAQRRRAGKQPMGAPVGDPWELDGFEMPPIIMAEIRQSPIPMDEILLSSERTIFDRVQAERQQQQQQQQQHAVASTWCSTIFSITWSFAAFIAVLKREELFKNAYACSFDFVQDAFLCRPLSFLFFCGSKLGISCTFTCLSTIDIEFTASEPQALRLLRPGTASSK